MQAVWDWHMPRETAADERALVRLAAQLGFDTLILHNPTPRLRQEAHAAGLALLAIVTPTAPPRFATQNPNALQQILPAEEAIADAIAGLDWEAYTLQAHRWFPIVQPSPLLCFQNPTAQAALKQRVQQALENADGIAFDGFGFRNHYACFCDACAAQRAEAAHSRPQEHPAHLLAQLSEQSLLGISEILYRHAKEIAPDALLTNHVWPPFRPNPAYASRLRLDFCSQTISWFYRPHWTLEQVAFEARQMAAQADARYNRFAPFIGLFDLPGLLRPPERIRAEIDIALQTGNGHLIFCSLRVLHRHPDIAAVVQAALENSSPETSA